MITMVLTPNPFPFQPSQQVQPLKATWMNLSKNKQHLCPIFLQ